MDLRAKLGKITRWTSAQSVTAQSLYTTILETINLATSQGWLKGLSWLDVEIEIDGRHLPCDSSRTLTVFGRMLTNRKCVGIQAAFDSEVRKGHVQPVASRQASSLPARGHIITMDVQLPP